MSSVSGLKASPHTANLRSLRSSPYTRRIFSSSTPFCRSFTS